MTEVGLFTRATFAVKKSSHTWGTDLFARRTADDPLFPWLNSYGIQQSDRELLNGGWVPFSVEEGEAGSADDFENALFAVRGTKNFAYRSNQNKQYPWTDFWKRPYTDEEMFHSWTLMTVPALTLGGDAETT